MAHGISLKMRGIEAPAPESISARIEGEGWLARVLNDTYVGPSRDRSLPGKARRRARKLARKVARLVEYQPFLKGHGVAGVNAYNQRYECPCGYEVVAPLDDLEFMTDVMEHETEHHERTGAAS